MWSTPIVALAVLAMAYASPIPALPDSPVGESTTLSTTTLGDLHSTEESTTKKQFTFKPFSFKPITFKTLKPITPKPTEEANETTTKFTLKTLKPFTFQTLKPFTLKPKEEANETTTKFTFQTLKPFSFQTLKPFTLKTTTKEPITEPVDKPLPQKGGDLETTSTTISSSSVNPIRNVRSAAFDGPGWQLVEEPTTVTVKPLDLTTTAPKENETTTSFSLPTLPTIASTTTLPTTTTTTAATTTTTAALPKRPVRAAVFGSDTWELTDEPTTVTFKPSPVTLKPLDLTTTLKDLLTPTLTPAEHEILHEEDESTEPTETSNSDGPGWQVSEDEHDIDMKDTKDSTTAAFTGSTISFKPLDLSTSIPTPAEHDIEHEEDSESSQPTETSDPEVPGWQVSEDEHEIDMKDTKDSTTTAFKSTSDFDHTTSAFEDFETTTSTRVPITTSRLLIRPKRVAGFPEAPWSLNGGMEMVDLTSTEIPSDDMENGDLSSTEIPDMENGDLTSTEIPSGMSEKPSGLFSGPGWQMEMPVETVQVHDDEIPSTTTIDSMLSESSMGEDSHPGWQLSETDATIGIDDSTTSAFTDLPSSTLDFETTMNDLEDTTTDGLFTDSLFTTDMPEDMSTPDEESTTIVDHM